MMRHSLFAVFFFLLFAPLVANANIRITEIMYDLEGSDSGREWIELTNDGSDPVDLTGYKLYEANTNHAVVLKNGLAVLGALKSAIIADDPAKFLIDWPSFGGTLFDSSFSLSNSGETLVIRRADLTDEDSVSYTSDMGAAGDGKSLTRSGSTFTASAPTPGTHDTGFASSSPSPSPAPSPTPPASPSSATAITGEPTKITVDVRVGKQLTVGADAFFEAESYGKEGKPLTSATYLWNFGNGDTLGGKSIRYAYRYPGTYIVMVSAANGFESATGRATVEVVPARVTPLAETDGSIAVLNGESREVEISAWILTRGGVTYIIPRGTFLYPNAGVRFSPLTTGLPVIGDVALLYPNGKEATAPETPPPAPPTPSRIDATEASRLKKAAANGASSPTQISPNDEISAGKPAKNISVIEKAEAAENTAAGAHALPAQSASGSLWLYVALAGMTGAGLLAALLLRRIRGNEFEIVEETDEN